MLIYPNNEYYRYDKCKADDYESPPRRYKKLKEGQTLKYENQYSNFTVYGQELHPALVIYNDVSDGMCKITLHYEMYGEVHFDEYDKKTGAFEEGNSSEVIPPQPGFKEDIIELTYPVGGLDKNDKYFLNVGFSDITMQVIGFDYGFCTLDEKCMVSFGHKTEVSENFSDDVFKHFEDTHRYAYDNYSCENDWLSMYSSNDIEQVKRVQKDVEQAISKVMELGQIACENFDIEEFCDSCERFNI